MSHTIDLFGEIAKIISEEETTKIFGLGDLPKELIFDSGDTFYSQYYKFFIFTNILDNSVHLDTFDELFEFSIDKIHNHALKLDLMNKFFGKTENVNTTKYFLQMKDVDLSSIVEIKNKKNMTPLMFLMIFTDYNRHTTYSDIKNIIDKYEKHWNPADFDRNGNTAFIYACKNSNLLVSMMINQFGEKCNFQKVSKQFGTALNILCSIGEKNFANKLIDLYPLQCNPKSVDYKKDTALMNSCNIGHDDLAIKIIETFGSECNIGQVSKNGKTALFYACAREQKNVIMKMLKVFGNKTFSNVNKISPSYNSIFMMLCDNPIMNNILDIMIKDHKKLCNVNFVSKYNSTALIEACSSKNVYAAEKILLTFDDCIVDVIDSYGSTALTYACQNKMTTVIRILVSKHEDKLNPYVKNIYGKTALDYACENKLILIVELLIAKYSKKIDSDDSHMFHDNKRIKM